jgi:hypothetical protein
MTDIEIIATVACPTCNAPVGEPCSTRSGLVIGAIHALRSQAARERRTRVANLGEGVPMPPWDCAWCGDIGNANPVDRFNVTWMLCLKCADNDMATEAMLTEGQRRRDRAMAAERAREEKERAERERFMASAYPQQDYKAEPSFGGRWLKPAESSVDCPICKQKAGTACLVTDTLYARKKGNVGMVRQSPHAQRVRAFEAATSEAADVIEVDGTGRILNPQWVALGEEAEERKRKDKVRPAAVLPIIYKREKKQPVPEEKSEGATLELRPIVGLWRPRLIDSYLVEGSDWPWTLGAGQGDIRVYYTLAERKLWVATISLDKDSPGGLARDFWPRGRGAFVALVERARQFHPVEISADHRGGGQRLRWYGVFQGVEVSNDCGVAEFLAMRSAAEALDTAERLRNPELNLKKPERKFNFEQ